MKRSLEWSCGLCGHALGVEGVWSVPWLSCMGGWVWDEDACVRACVGSGEVWQWVL